MLPRTRSDAPKATPPRASPSPGTGTRAELLAALRAHPGATVAHLAREVGVDHSTATYHLDRLVARGLAVTRRHGGRRHCFPADGAPAGARALAICARRGRAGLVLARLDTRPRGLAEVAAGLPITKTGVQWHLRRLVALGLVVVDAGPRGRAYRLAEDVAAPDGSPGSSLAPSAPRGPGHGPYRGSAPLSHAAAAPGSLPPDVAGAPAWA